MVPFALWDSPRISLSAWKSLDTWEQENRPKISIPFTSCLAAMPQILVGLSEDFRKQTFYSKAFILLMLLMVA